MPLLDLHELENISPVFRGRVGNSFGRGLMHLLSVDKVNELYDRNCHLEGRAFAHAVLDDIGLEYKMSIAGNIREEDIAEIIPKGSFITISNHPCGHVDGLCLVDLLGAVRPDYKVMVNSMLGRIETLKDNFITVTPTGADRTAPTAASISGVKEALRHLRTGGALGLFPSGAVSDLSLTEMTVRDRQWQESVIRLIAKAGVPVLPIRFLDGNSPFYYTLGLIDWRIRLLRLPSEVFNKRGRPFRICIGPLIRPEEYRCFARDMDLFRTFLRSSVYGMELGRLA